jgi:hypothetical protein
MPIDLDAWLGGVTVVTDSNRCPQLWLDGSGELCDRLGPDQSRHPIDDLDELVVFVAEWIVCAHGSGDTVAYSDIHPAIRAAVYELIPSTLEISDEDDVSFTVS